MIIDWDVGEEINSFYTEWVWEGGSTGGGSGPPPELNRRGRRNCGFSMRDSWR